ncbi:hypothetical protein OFO01_06965 [Campylobacter sp. JMF_01 NE2]|uniref:ImmA/IrrE family metallo-endopeptidase n=1 Tax=unclassified Campylobacter TaxID=2593542 RepID=UPI0022E9C57D|nr:MULTISPECIES: hypothetical protein [unclassified Campylobacter]MDA3053297.1 hypothetical protein [Campylobacter sp. JMF_03 NE3]MDA3067520.1 hypothetical protein [Campylobacter sp. JMF_01 NE2]
MKKASARAKEFLAFEAAFKQKVGGLIESMLQGRKGDDRSKEAMKYFADYLQQFKHLHKYSSRNVAIALEQAHARGFAITHLASYKACQNFKNDAGEHARVKPGEKALIIVRPNIMKEQLPEDKWYHNEKNQLVTEQEIVVSYSPCPVFDAIHQTNAREIGAIKPVIYPIQHYGNDEQEKVAGKLYEYLATTMEKKYDVPVVVEDIGRLGVLGQTNGKQISIAVGVQGDIDKLSVLTHEIGHTLMHFNEDRKEYSKEVKELQAEMFAYLLNDRLGFDAQPNTEYLYDYLTAHIKDKVSDSVQLLRLKDEDPHLFRNKLADIFLKAIGNVFKPYSEFMQKSKLDEYIGEVLDMQMSQKTELKQENTIKQNQNNDENLNEGVSLK